MAGQFDPVGDPVVTYNDYQSQLVENVPPIVTGGSAVTTINSATGPIITISGGSTGLTFSTGSSTISLSGTLAVANGGTGTATAFTLGSIVFAGASGVYSQDNTNFFWDDTNNRLKTNGIEFPAISPAQITADQNNYNPGTGAFFRLSSDAARNITGITGGVDGRVIRFVNVGANNIVLQNENVSSTAANRIITGTGADVTLAADDTSELQYDATTQRWRLFT